MASNKRHVRSVRSIALLSENGVSSLEYLLVSGLLLVAFYVSGMTLMAITNWLYAYWTTALVSPIL